MTIYLLSGTANPATNQELTTLGQLYPPVHDHTIALATVTGNVE